MNLHEKLRTMSDERLDRVIREIHSRQTGLIDNVEHQRLHRVYSAVMAERLIRRYERA